MPEKKRRIREGLGVTKPSVLKHIRRSRKAMRLLASEEPMGKDVRGPSEAEEPENGSPEEQPDGE